MTHECLRCGAGTCNNERRAWCRQCGEPMHSTFDEPEWQHADDYRDVEDDEDDDAEEQA